MIFQKNVVKTKKIAALMSILFRKPECHSVNDGLHDIFSAEEDLMHLLFGTKVWKCGESTHKITKLQAFNEEIKEVISWILFALPRLAVI